MNFSLSFYYYLGNFGEGRWLSGFLYISLLFSYFLVCLFTSWFAGGFAFRQEFGLDAGDRRGSLGMQGAWRL
jgi:hypothetical protein